MNMPENWNDLVLTAIVPVFNEETTLEAAVNRIHEVAAARGRALSGHRRKTDDSDDRPRSYSRERAGAG